MKKLNKNWFTLIEFLIAMTIFFILVVMSFANYLYYQNISKVKISLKEVSQSINNTRNLALSWLDIWWKNQSVAILLKKDESKTIIYNFDFDKNYSDIDLNSLTPNKEVQLQKWVNIKNIKSWSYNDLSEILIYYSSIKAKPEFLKLRNDWVWEVLNTKDLTLKLSYKNSWNYPLLRELNYKKLTNVVDY